MVDRDIYIERDKEKAQNPFDLVYRDKEKAQNPFDLVYGCYLENYFNLGLHFDRCLQASLLRCK